MVNGGIGGIGLHCAGVQYSLVSSFIANGVEGGGGVRV